MPSELKPCPFCGEAPRLRRATNTPREWWILGCESVCCGLNPEIQADAETAAVTFWNTRAPSPEVEALVAAARQVEELVGLAMCKRRHGESVYMDGSHRNPNPAEIRVASDVTYELRAALKPFEDDWEPPVATSGDDGH